MTARKPRKLVRGLIIWATTPDPAGRNPKRRPVVLLTSQEEVPAGNPLIGVGITGTLPAPLPSDYVLLPWHRSRHPYTGLTKKCAAWCNWRVTIPPNDELEVMGRVPDNVFAEICNKVKAAIDAQPSQQPPPA
jgi:mRNA-degrading endonuclease toxin of MazEF toxin-antitoxin module